MNRFCLSPVNERTTLRVYPEYKTTLLRPDLFKDCRRLWLLVPLANTEARDLLEIIEARHKKGSTIFSSQFTPAGWHGKIGEGTLADAILDRIVHVSYTILIDGEESMRKRKGISI